MAFSFQCIAILIATHARRETQTRRMDLGTQQGKERGGQIERPARLMYTAVLSHVQLTETPWTVARQAPLSMGFSKQEYWSGLPFPSPGDLPNPGIKPRSPAWKADSLPSEPPGSPYIYLH